MSEEKRLKDMNLGELVEGMLVETIRYVNKLHALKEGEEDQTRQLLVEKYRTAIDPFKEELSRREQLYKSK